MNIIIDYYIKENLTGSTVFRGAKLLYKYKTKKDLRAFARRSLSLKRVIEEKLDQHSLPSKVLEF